MKSKMERIINNSVSKTIEFISLSGSVNENKKKNQEHAYYSEDKTGATGDSYFYKDDAINNTNIGATGMFMETGETGATAATATGCIYDISTTFINLYSFSNKIPSGNDCIIFNTTTASNGKCGHCEDDSNIWIWETGHFYFHIYTNDKEPYIFSILKNDVPVPIKQLTTNKNNNYYTTIVEISPNDLILSNPFVDDLACKINFIVRRYIQDYNDDRISFMYHYEKEDNGWFLTPYISTNVCIILLQK